MEKANAFSPFYSLITYLVISTICASAIRYAWLTVGLGPARSGKGESQEPPLLPYAVPILGHLPLKFFWDPLGFSYTYPAFWKQQTVRVRAFFQDIYIIQGAEDLVSFFSQRSLSSFFLHRVFLANVFLLPATAVETYRKDNSGEDAKPHPGTTVSHHNRVEFHLRLSQHRLLVGPGQQSLFRRFEINVIKRLSSLGFTEEWTHIPDLLSIFTSDLTAAVLDSMAGPALLQRHPSFAKDLWDIDEGIMSFVLKKPRFMNPKAHQARQRALAAILDWQTWARENFAPETVDKDGNDPFWGCKFFRERQEMFSNMDGFGPNAVASEDLSFIWSANTNANISSFWITLEAFRDPDLLRAVREEVQQCIQIGQENQPSFDISKLLRQPLLQAMFAENLRLRVHGFLIRRPELGDIRINNWTLQRNHLCVASATPAAMDPEFWCTGENSAYPVDKFRPGRFLKKDMDTNALQFSFAGTEGHWVPFGGGPHGCPGKMFTKRQNFLTLALMVTLYDCEFLAGDESQSMKSGIFPLGVIPPSGKNPVRIRRRVAMEPKDY